MHEILSKVPLLSTLSHDDLESLGQRVSERSLEKDEILFEEGSSGTVCYIVAEGELAVTRRSGERDVLVAVRGPGEVLGEMALIDDALRSASVRAKKPSLVIEIDKDAFDDLLASSSSASMAMLRTFASRLRALQATVHQSEKMAALGTMTAGVAHELNNPAAAVRRAAEQLSEALANLEMAGLRLDALSLEPQQREALIDARGASRAASGEPVVLDTLARSDLEAEVESWLESRGLSEAWQLAPQLVSAGLDVAALDDLSNILAEDHLPVVLPWLAAGLAVDSLLAEIRNSTARLTDIIGAMKEYAYLDQAPVQEVDVHKSLDNTLIMLQHKLKSGVTVTRQYAADIPPITAYGSELSQVWTNLIDNAVDAMGGSGHLLLRTRCEADEVVVEIEDDGPGITQSVQDRLFEPFFTTKGPGKGTGLGLHISRNIVEKHHGEISLRSQPGQTTFQVRLPIDFNSRS